MSPFFNSIRNTFDSWSFPILKVEKEVTVLEASVAISFVLLLFNKELLVVMLLLLLLLLIETIVSFWNV
jgi:hypothetical protein